MKKMLLIPAVGDHGLWPWRSAPSCGRNVAPHRRWARSHWRCLWGSISLFFFHHSIWHRSCFGSPVDLWVRSLCPSTGHRSPSGDDLPLSCSASVLRASFLLPTRSPALCWVPILGIRILGLEMYPVRMAKGLVPRPLEVSLVSSC